MVYWQRSVGVAWLVPREMLPFRRRFCVHHSTMHQVIVSLHSKPHRQGVCVFSSNLPPALLAEWPGSFTCYCGNTGVDGYRNKSQHRKLTQEKKIFPPLLPGLEPRTFRSRVRRSNHWAIPAPQSHKTVSTDHNFWRARRTEADSSQGPSAYQPNALPLGQTGSQKN